MNIEVIRDTHTVVRAIGEVDLSNVNEFREALDDAAENAPKGFIIDLSDTTYIDSAGVHAIFRAYAKMRQSDGNLAVVVGNVRIKSVLEVVHLEQLPGLSVFENLTSARDAIPVTAGAQTND